MTFLWPEMLWLLLGVPLLVLAYWFILRRRKKAFARYSNLTMVREAMGAGGKIRRHLPPLLLLAALSGLIFAVARPAAVVTLPMLHETIILAMDVSGSMRAADVEPNRITASQNAARAFIADIPATTRIGIVAFAGAASLVQPPTLSREDVEAAIGRFQLQRGTAVGSAILVSLKTLFPDIEFDLRSANPRPGADKKGVSIEKAQEPGKEKFKPVPPGSHGAAAIVLLTDGQTTAGPDPIESAKMAAERGVRVFTVGVGTTKGEILGSEGWSMRVKLDEESLKTIANLTRGEYFHASTAKDLKKVYETLSSRLVFEKKDMEITALFAAGSALLALVSALLSLAWFNRIL